MALQYSAEFLLHLRDSPLCVKPDSLPPAEDWMGPQIENIRSQPKSIGDRSRVGDNPLLDQTNRRPALDRHASRTSANPEDIVFAPPRMSFSSASARGTKTSENDKSIKDGEVGRFGLRNRSGDLDNERLRDGRGNPLRRRGDGDQDGDGWSMVKPRKSFGAEGAERFHGKMGGNFRDEKRPTKDKDERDATRDRVPRPFDTFGRDKDGADAEGRRNGSNRSKLDSWHRNEGNDVSTPEKKERDRTKSWRDRDREPDAFDDRAGGRQSDRRWGRDRDQRDQRVERDPEWFDEPASERREAHTQQDFQKWMEQMKKAKGASSAAAGSSASAATTPAVVESTKPPVASPPAVESGPDKFFLAFGGSGASMDAASTSTPKDATVKAKSGGKSSRFTSFFSQPSDIKPEQPHPVPVPMPSQDGPSAGPPSMPLPLPMSMSMPGQSQAQGHPPEEERQAFQQLLAKLQKQTMSATPPGPSPFSAPPQSGPAEQSKRAAVASPESFQQYGGDRRETPLGRPPSQQAQEILAPRPQQQSARPEQLLQDLVGHHQRVSSQGSGRPDAGPRHNSNTEFLMNLMRAGPDGQRSGPPQQQHMMGMPQQHLHHQEQPPKHQHQMQPSGENDNDYQMRENRGPQRQSRQHPPPGFPVEESFHGGDHEGRSTQPTQILQRPIPPPGLDQMPPNWMGGGQMPPPPQQRGPMIPPPGLAGRNVPMPHMFPPNFPPGGMPPDGMPGMPPRNMPPPPPGFFNGPPPHGFMPPGIGGFNGPPGPDAPGFGGSPFEGRGMPPPGNGGRGTNYGRP